MLTVVNFGMGNLRSVLNALSYLGTDPVVVERPEDLFLASKIILPGVGSYRRAMENIRVAGLEEPLRHMALERGIPLLGICLGMQILGHSGTEDGYTEGLGLIDGIVDRFQWDSSLHPDIRIPHVGFNTVRVCKSSPLFHDLGEAADFYFTHSYRMTCHDSEAVVATCWHGEEFVAAVQKRNVYGTQYHPEKSQSNGLIQLRNFLERV